MLDVPEDVLWHVALHLDQPSVERLLSTCRALRRSDDFYVGLGRLQWGSAFWRDAFMRPTLRPHVYRGMRHELRRMHVHACELRRLDLPAWTHADYRAWWECEARAVHARSAQQQRPVRIVFGSRECIA